MVKVNYQLTHQEIVHLSGTVYYQYLKDIHHFEKYSSEYNSNFLTYFESKIRDIQNDVNIPSLCQDVKNEKAFLHTSYSELRPLLHQLKSFAVSAFSCVDQCEKRFGFEKIQRAINNKNMEYLVEELPILLQKLDSDCEDLVKEGVPRHLVADVHICERKIAYHHNALAKSEDRLQRGTMLNIEHSNVLWGILKKICEAGKKIFRSEDWERSIVYDWELLKAKEKEIPKEE